MFIRVSCVTMLLPSDYVSLEIWFSLIIKTFFHFSMMMVLILSLPFPRFSHAQNNLNQGMYIIDASLLRAFQTLNRHLNIHQYHLIDQVVFLVHQIGTVTPLFLLLPLYLAFLFLLAIHRL